MRYSLRSSTKKTSLRPKNFRDFGTWDKKKFGTWDKKNKKNSGQGQFSTCVHLSGLWDIGTLGTLYILDIWTVEDLGLFAGSEGLLGHTLKRVEADENQSSQESSPQESRGYCIHARQYSCLQFWGIVPVLVESSIEGDTRSQDKQSPLLANSPVNMGHKNKSYWQK